VITRRCGRRKANAKRAEDLLAMFDHLALRRKANANRAEDCLVETSMPGI
jgi:hypothetical protein